MAAISELHEVLSRTTWMFFLAIGLWGLFRAIRAQSVDGSYLGAMVVGQLLFVVQLILGVILLTAGGRPVRPGIHIIYGLFSLVFLPFVFGYIRGDDSNRAQWIYAFSTLFLFGIVLRSMETGG